MTRSLFLLPLVVLAGCTRPAEITDNSQKGDGQAKQAADPWLTVATDVRKATDAAAYRRALAQLNSDLSNNPSAAEPLADAAAKKLAATGKLSDDEAKDLLSPVYSSLDGQYLADCVYLRDAARSLDVAGQPADKQAAAAFAWVCRQVYLRPPPVPFSGPPTAVLRRGCGVGLERAYIFIALLQQLGLDGVFVGPPGREAAPGVVIGPDDKPVRGPFWAVGVKAAADVVLFDPWRGEPVPGTLAQVKASADVLKPWAEDKANPWDVPRSEVEPSIVYAVLPLAAAAPRMKPLEKTLAATVGVKLAIDPDELTARVGGPLWLPPATGQPPVGFVLAYPRMLAAFALAADGGKDRGELTGALVRERIPLSMYAGVADLRSPAAQQQLRLLITTQYANVILENDPREKMQRGQINEATKLIVGKEGEYAKVGEQMRSDPATDERVKAWYQKGNEVYGKLSRAMLPENVADRPEAEAGVANFWKSESAALMIVIGRATVSVGRAETAYLLALCMHEKAERAQAQIGRGGDAAKAAEAWAAAADAWGRYLTLAEDQSSYPGRVEHARKLAALAKR